ncbi:cell wall-binding repeat-containing protein [Desulfosporosinus sp. FKA]|uniref:cell wall-binding repeat-containing protein n=1 Tax=Desulfosporosinus sp. FKA TaxID=1969834 RepID=UPI000B4A3E66|nr:cell wall-binding repeat-containing protein [Desulfosporosinus sp. FKA]
MNKKAKLTSVAVTSTLLLVTLVGSVQAKPYYKPHFNRYSGQDRFQTSTAIAQKELRGQQMQNVVLASAYSFPDALSASTLATKLNASIILVGSDVNDSQDSLNFVKNHLKAGGNVTIIGGVGVINEKVEQWLHKAGYHVRRMGGFDRFATNSIIVNNLNVSPGTPVIVASGNEFPDALGVASLAASKGWPILLSSPTKLPDNVKDFISKDQPSNIYIVGGKAVINGSLQTTLQSLVPNAQIQRFGGQDRFETLSQILTKFYPNPTQIYLANGYDYADALSGSTLAAQNNAPILLIDPKSRQLPPSIKDYLITIRNTGSNPQINVLGGSVGVPDWAVNLVSGIFGDSTSSSGVIPVTVSNPSTTGITVGLNPALNGLTANNFTLLNSSGNSIGVTGATTSNGGAAYTVNAPLNVGQTYTLRVNYNGNSVGTVQTFTVPYVTSNQTVTVSNPSTSGFTVGLSSLLNGLTAGNFTLKNSYGYTVPITGVTTLNGGATYTVSAALSAGQTYTLTANYAGYTLGTSQSFTVPYTNVNSETLTVSTPSLTGFTVGLSSALNGLTINNFTLLNSSGYSIPITGVTTLNGGATYTISAALSAGQTYTLTANYAGYTMGTAQSFTIPYNTSNVTYTVNNLSTTGFKVGLSTALNGLTIGNFTLLDSSGNRIAISSVTTSDGGTTYTISAALNVGQTYTLTANYNGYAFGTSQSFVIPSV